MRRNTSTQRPKTRRSIMECNASTQRPNPARPNMERNTSTQRPNPERPTIERNASIQRPNPARPIWGCNVSRQRPNTRRPNVGCNTSILIRGRVSCSFMWGCRQLTFTSVIDDEIVVESQTLTPSCSNCGMRYNCRIFYCVVNTI